MGINTIVAIIRDNNMYKIFLSVLKLDQIHIKTSHFSVLYSSTDIAWGDKKIKGYSGRLKVYKIHPYLK